MLCSIKHIQIKKTKTKSIVIGTVLKLLLWLLVSIQETIIHFCVNLKGKKNEVGSGETFIVSRLSESELNPGARTQTPPPPGRVRKARALINLFLESAPNPRRRPPRRESCLAALG